MRYGFRIMVEGDYACFTRPEMKVERVSYEVPTPSAIEGMLKSIYWKPSIYYVIDKIIIFSDVNFINVRRNEVSDKLLFSRVKKQMNHDLDGDLSIYASECRNQRASMLLKNVKYGVEFHFELSGIRSDDEGMNSAKHYSIIKRRIEKGQFYRIPTLGMSEFPVKKLSLVDDFDMSLISPSIRAAGDVDLGYMVYRLVYEDGGRPINQDWENPVFSDKAKTIYYRPHMVEGIIDVQKYAERLLC